MKLEAKNFWHSAEIVLRVNFGTPGSVSALRVFKANFGVTPHVCEAVWNTIERALPRLASPKHLLWCLIFLKSYDTEHVSASRVGADEKTYRRWVWAFLDLISNLQFVSRNQESRQEDVTNSSLHRKVNWDNRQGRGHSEGAIVSVDGTDFRIQEPTPFDKAWYSYKLNGTGLRYDVGVCIETGEMVRLHGPFPCGAFTDLVIFRSHLKGCLEDDEKVIADSGYRDDKCVNPYNQQMENSELHSTIRARHETLNRRLKQFSVLRNTFRHNLSLHGSVFFAVANLTQLMLRSTEPLFSVNLP